MWAFALLAPRGRSGSASPIGGAAASSAYPLVAGLARRYADSALAARAVQHIPVSDRAALLSSVEIRADARRRGAGSDQDRNRNYDALFAVLCTDDFRAGRVVSLKGLIVSQTEAAALILCAQPVVQGC